MFPYENVKSIHNQKLTQFVAQREKAQLTSMLKAGHPGPMERLAKTIGEGLKSAGTVLANRRNRPIRLA